MARRLVQGRLEPDGTEQSGDEEVLDQRRTIRVIRPRGYFCDDAPCRRCTDFPDGLVSIAGLCCLCDAELDWPRPGEGWNNGACSCGAITTLYDGLCKDCRELARPRQDDRHRGTVGDALRERLRRRRLGY